MLSLDEPFVMASTKLQLSHRNSTLFLLLTLPHMMQLITIRILSHYVDWYPLRGPGELEPLIPKPCSTAPRASCVCPYLVYDQRGLHGKCCGGNCCHSR